MEWECISFFLESLMESILVSGGSCRCDFGCGLFLFILQMGEMLVEG